MKIIISIPNRQVNFNEAINLQFQIFEIIVKYKIYTHSLINKKVKKLIEDVTKEELSEMLYKSVKKYLVDPKDKNTARGGYDLWIPSDINKVFGNITMRFGTPEISGRDIITLEIKEDYFKDNYHNIITKVYPLLLELIPLVKPNFAVCLNWDLKEIINNDDYDYGHIVYKKNSKLLDLASGKDIKLEPFAEGYLWKSDFSSYPNSLALIEEVWN